MFFHIIDIYYCFPIHRLRVTINAKYLLLTLVFPQYLMFWYWAPLPLERRLYPNYVHRNWGLPT